MLDFTLVNFVWTMLIYYSLKIKQMLDTATTLKKDVYLIHLKYSIPGIWKRGFVPSLVLGWSESLKRFTNKATAFWTPFLKICLKHRNNKLQGSITHEVFPYLENEKKNWRNFVQNVAAHSHLVLISFNSLKLIWWHAWLASTSTWVWFSESGQRVQTGRVG